MFVVEVVCILIYILAIIVMVKVYFMMRQMKDETKQEIDRMRQYNRR